METERGLLEEYVAHGKLLQVASISDSGHPTMCHVWYFAKFRPDRLYFISRHDRVHSVNIRQDGRVAGGIVSIPLEGLGQRVRGVTFTGNASQLGADASGLIEDFSLRWPNAREIISAGKIARGETASRIFQIEVVEWVLFDEDNFPGDPRRTIPAASSGS